MKRCTICDISKEFSEFDKQKGGIGGVSSWCRVCRKEYRKQHYQKNKEYFSNKNHKWRTANKQRRSQINRSWASLNKTHRKKYKEEYRQKNAEKIRAYKRKLWEKNKQNPEFRLQQSLRSKLRKAMRAKDNTRRSLEYVGCSIPFLKAHIESLFTDGMCWQNYGRWHIDHIKPVASFDLSKQDEILRCFHYTNLQPLWACDNLAKGAKCIIEYLRYTP